jgi:hypothetical protein
VESEVKGEVPLLRKPLCTWVPRLAVSKKGGEKLTLWLYAP